LLTNETLTSENNNSGIIDSCPGCGRPHTAYLIAKISKAKDLSLNLLINVFSLSTLHVLWKKNQAITLLQLFTHSQPFNEMFIVSGKSRCCNGTFLNVLFTLLRKNI